jgi:hypothetical protein
MIRKALVLSTLAVFIVGAAFAGPDKSKAQKKPAKPSTKTQKLVVINTCPITNEDASSAAGGSEVVGKYKVNFCCAGCKPNFDKLSKDEKEKKLAEMAKKQSDTKKS